MAENSKIEWTDHTFNPWMGCTKVSPACANCYAERDFDHRYGKVKWGNAGTRVLTSDANWKKPLQWNKDAEKSGNRQRVFCASLADVFENWQGPIKDSRGLIGHVFDDGEWGFGPDGADGTNNYRGGSNVSMLTMNDVRDRLFRLIDSTPYLDWLLLTKRPDNVSLMWPIHPSGRHQEGMSFADAYRRDNVWLGTSVENQEYADKRIPELLKCRDLSPVLFLSCEPVVGQINLPYCEDQLEFGFDWVITGGESGPNARPADPDWFRSLRDQCKTAGVPFHFKQWGEFDEHQNRVGKKNAGRLLDGEKHDGLPVQYFLALAEDVDSSSRGETMDTKKQAMTLDSCPPADSAEYVGATIPITIEIPELNVPIKFWACPCCEGQEVKWRGNKAWCAMCGRSNDDSVCQCGQASYKNLNGDFVGCCAGCLPF